MSGRKLFPIRECKSCKATTRSTSTIDHCVRCGDNDGLRPRHFLTRDRDGSSEPSSTPQEPK